MLDRIYGVLGEECGLSVHVICIIHGVGYVGKSTLGRELRA